MNIPGLKIGRKYPWDASIGGYYWSTPTPERWAPANEHNQCVGADLASAATIAPTHECHVVTGTAAIDNITLPWVGFAGRLILISLAASTLTTAGNIAKAVTFVANQVNVLYYVPATGKWYPHALA